MRRAIGDHTDAGTILSALNVRNIPRLPCVLPSRELLRFADNLFLGIRRSMEHRLSVNTELATLRDTLLPKLISGDLRVPDAERFLADAGVS